MPDLDLEEQLAAVKDQRNLALEKANNEIAYRVLLEIERDDLLVEVTRLFKENSDLKFQLKGK